MKKLRKFVKTIILGIVGWTVDRIFDFVELALGISRSGLNSKTSKSLKHAQIKRNAALILFITSITTLIKSPIIGVIRYAVLSIQKRFAIFIGNLGGNWDLYKKYTSQKDFLIQSNKIAENLSSYAADSKLIQILYFGLMTIIFIIIIGVCAKSFKNIITRSLEIRRFQSKNKKARTHQKQSIPNKQIAS